MTKSTKAQKWVLAGIVGSILAVVAAVWIVNAIQASKAADAKERAEEAVATQKLQDHLLEAKEQLEDQNVKLIRVKVGPVTASKLEACYGGSMTSECIKIEKLLACYTTGSMTKECTRIQKIESCNAAGLTMSQCAESDRFAAELLKESK
jgi:hypothetical protein